MEQALASLTTLPSTYWVGLMRPGATAASPWYAETDPDRATSVYASNPQATPTYWHGAWQFYSTALANTASNCMVADSSLLYGEQPRPGARWLCTEPCWAAW